MSVPAVISYPTPPAFASSFALGTKGCGRGELISFASPPGRMDEAEFADWRLVYNYADRALPLTIRGIGGETFSLLLQPDETVIMAPFTRTVWGWESLAQCDVLQIPASFLEAVLLSAFGRSATPTSSLTHLGESRAGEAMSMLRECLKRDRDGGQLIAESLTKIAITRIARGFEKGVLAEFQILSRAPVDRLPADIGFAGLVAHLRAHPCDRLSIAEMEHVSGLRRASLGRRFRSKYNVSPTDFSRRLMSDEACRKLKLKSATLSQIAQECGFSDQPHMSRVVKSLTGLTPSQFQ